MLKLLLFLHYHTEQLLFGYIFPFFLNCRDFLVYMTHNLAEVKAGQHCWGKVIAVCVEPKATARKQLSLDK